MHRSVRSDSKIRYGYLCRWYLVTPLLAEIISNNDQQYSKHGSTYRVYLGLKLCPFCRRQARAETYVRDDYQDKYSYKGP
jgi:hypothetical protein